MNQEQTYYFLTNELKTEQAYALLSKVQYYNLFISLMVCFEK